ncbi:MAG: hypothetical protein ABIV39_12890 [Verrucomicrobiota bacterium]
MNEGSTGHQPPNPDLLMHLTLVLLGFKRFLTLSANNHPNPAMHRFYSVIEAIVEGFVEGLLQ